MPVVTFDQHSYFLFVFLYEKKNNKNILFILFPFEFPRWFRNVITMIDSLDES